MKTRFKTIENAEKRIRLLERRLADYERICIRMDTEKEMLAMLAARAPAFSDASAEAEATRLLNDVLGSISRRSKHLKTNAE